MWQSCILGMDSIPAILYTRDGFDTGIRYLYSIFTISILENHRKVTYRNINCIVSYQMEHQYTKILSNNLAIWTKQNFFEETEN